MQGPNKKNLVETGSKQSESRQPTANKKLDPLCHSRLVAPAFMASGPMYSSSCLSSISFVTSQKASHVEDYRIIAHRSLIYASTLNRLNLVVLATKVLCHLNQLHWTTQSRACCLLPLPLPLPFPRPQNQSPSPSLPAPNQVPSLNFKPELTSACVCI